MRYQVGEVLDAIAKKGTFLEDGMRSIWGEFDVTTASVGHHSRCSQDCDHVSILGSLEKDINQNSTALTPQPSPPASPLYSNVKLTCNYVLQALIVAQFS